MSEIIYRKLRSTEEFNAAVQARANQDYQEFLRSPYWQDVKSLVFARDRFRCTKCNSNCGLQVHHLTYEHHGDELRHLDDMTTLCRLCHCLEHAKEQRA